MVVRADFKMLQKSNKKVAKWLQKRCKNVAKNITSEVSANQPILAWLGLAGAELSNNKSII